MPVSLALLAALLFALSAVAQQRAAAGAPAGTALLGALVRSPVWLAGTAAGGLGFVALVGARASGPLLLVQPLLATTLLAARRPPGTARAVLLAAAAAISFALGAVLPAGVVEALGRGPLAALTTWPTWAVLAAALGGSWLQQAAYQAGDLTASLPVVTAGEQGVAAALGVVVLGERVAPGPVAVLAFLVVLVAAAALARAAEPAREHLRH